MVPGARPHAGTGCRSRPPGHSRAPPENVAEVAIAWTLQNAAVTGAIVGARRPGGGEFVRAPEVTLDAAESRPGSSHSRRGADAS